MADIADRSGTTAAVEVATRALERGMVPVGGCAQLWSGVTSSKAVLEAVEGVRA